VRHDKAAAYLAERGRHCVSAMTEPRQLIPILPANLTSSSRPAISAATTRGIKHPKKTPLNPVKTPPINKGLKSPTYGIFILERGPRAAENDNDRPARTAAA
jgi:hypothetical protein